MNDTIRWQMLASNSDSHIDMAVVLAFIAFSLVAFLAPAVGYQSGNSLGVRASLYLLAGCVGASCFQLVLQLIWEAVVQPAAQSGYNLSDDAIAEAITRTNMGYNPRLPPTTSPSRFGEVVFVLHMVFALLKMGLFLGAMISFTVGLRVLQTRRPTSGS